MGFPLKKMGFPWVSHSKRWGFHGFPTQKDGGSISFSMVVPTRPDQKRDGGTPSGDRLFRGGRAGGNRQRGRWMSWIGFEELMDITEIKILYKDIYEYLSI
jgi:hypothetical protein